MAKRFIIILLNLFVANAVISQTSRGFNQVPVKNFTRNEYKSGNQNWNIAQDRNGVVYFANNNGLLVFNGNAWRVCPLPNHTTVRSVATDNSGRIYVGSFQEFGYFVADEFGTLHYTSLSALLKNYDFHNEEIWKIIIHDDAVYFQSFTVIFKYKNNQIETIIPEGFISCFNLTGNRLMLNINSKGLTELKDNRFEIISDNEIFKNHQVTSIMHLSGNRLLIATLQDGIFIFKDTTGLEEWNCPLQKELAQSQVNKALIDKNGDIILGTILRGLYIFTKNGKLVNHIEKESGLQNNTVLDLFCDFNGDLWVGLDCGIDLLLLNSNISFYYDFSGKVGSVYSILKRNKTLYIGTNQGLYRSPVSDSEDQSELPEFKLLDNSQGQVWTIYDAGSQLLCGHNLGTFEIDEGKITRISNISGASSFETLYHKGIEYLIGSTYTKLVVYEKKAGKWKFRNEIEGFMHPVKQIKIDYLGNIWASHFVKGLYRLNFNDSLTRVENIVQYGKLKGFRSDYQIKVIRLQNRIVFINEGKLFIYNDLLDSIVEYSEAEKKLNTSLTIRNLIPDGTNHTWMIADEGIYYLDIENSIWKVKVKLPMDMFYNKLIIGQEFIYSLGNGSAILALDNGLSFINADSTKVLNSFKVKPLFTSVLSFGKNEIKYPLVQNNGTRKPEIPYRQNNLVFRYAYPLYRDSAMFLVKLEGLDLKWRKTDRPEFSYDRIPPGSYTFVVKAVANGVESESIKWTFVIKSPWYLSILAKIIYFILIISLVAILRLYFKRRMQNQTRRMKIEKERELIKLRNEKLEAEISHKTKELANTTLSIIKKNELLLEIRKLMMQQRRQSALGSTSKLTGIIKLLDRNISNEDDWTVFESNFEQAHEEFLKRIKEKIPDLTPSDLKLCAYLRMNLSSKKIALLLGITIRGVENHRYRLRKKIGLEHDSNLIDYLMKF
ncbi:MAG: hypothetical protein U0W24_21365 [Bacteroidales bacterium]